MASHGPKVDLENLTLPPATRRWGFSIGGLGLILLAVAFATGLSNETSTASFYRAFLVSFTYVLSLSLGALFFILIQHLFQSGWSVPIRRFAEVVATNVLPLALGVIVVVIGLEHLYEWAHEGVMDHDPILAGKEPWLNSTFFVVRLLIYFAVWSALSWYFLSRSRSQDVTKDPRTTLAMQWTAAPGMLLYALTVTAASFDLIMSLYPHWYSTIFGVYFFAGGVLGFFALTAVAAALFRGGRLGQVIRLEHFHDIGKLMLAFVVFWAYIAFSQYMLIWYGNLPEETVFYEIRQTGPWVNLSLLLLFGHFFVPFLALISRHPKRRSFTLTLAAVWLLLMHWADLFYLIVPGSREGQAPFQMVDVLCFLGLFGLFLGITLWRLGRGSAVAVGDPRLPESLRYENV